MRVSAVVVGETAMPMPITPVPIAAVPELRFRDTIYDRKAHKCEHCDNGDRAEDFHQSRCSA